MKKSLLILLTVVVAVCSSLSLGAQTKTKKASLGAQAKKASPIALLQRFYTSYIRSIDRMLEYDQRDSIIATALTETGSKMDEVIFEEFKGTGNMELQLDRRISNRRIFPAIDLIASSTRRDDLLLDENTLNRTWVLRKYLAEMNPIEAMEFMEKQMKLTRNNEEFLATMNN